MAGDGDTPVPMMISPGKNLKGQQLGRYTLLEHLATGGMAEIFLARQEGQGGFVKELVLKTLQARYVTDPRVLAMFLDEARLAAQINHPNVVDVYEVGEEAGVHYIAMQFIPGKTLTELVRRGIEVSLPMSIAHVAFIVGQAAWGLGHMQGALDAGGRPLDIVHRDISPSNLIVDFAGHTKIIDFGIAQQGRNIREEAGARPGKVSYMSPEQITGRPLDGRSDIFSLGTILYELTLRKRLWRGPAEGVMRRIVEETPPPPTYVDRAYPRDLELIVMKALEKRPDDRYQSGSDLASDLETYLDGLEVRTAYRHLAAYVHELFSPQAEVSPKGARRARAFLADDDEGSDAGADDELDFDRRPLLPAGAALAQILKASGPLRRAAAPDADVARQTDAPEAKGASPAAPQAPTAATAPKATEDADVVVPRKSRLVWGLVLAAALGAGLLLALART